MDKEETNVIVFGVKTPKENEPIDLKKLLACQGIEAHQLSLECL